MSAAEQETSGEMRGGDPGQAKQTNDPPVPASGYVVQRRVVVRAQDGAERPMWEDIATLELPTRSRRTTAVLSALEEKDLEVSVEDRFRVLDGEASREFAPRERPTPSVSERFEIVEA